MMYTNANRKRRKIRDQIRQSKNIGIGKDRPNVGFAYAIIPNDMDRSEYLAEFYKTGMCLIITPYNQVLKNVIVPEHLIDYIKFPQAKNDYGSLLSYNSESTSNQVIVTGIIINNKPKYPTSENTYVSAHSTKNYALNIIKNLDARSYIVSSYNSEDSVGGISFSSKSDVGKSRVSILNNGGIEIEADQSINQLSEQGLNITIGSDDDIKTLTITKEGSLHYKDQFNNELVVNEDGVNVISTKINLGSADANHNAILGDELVSWLGKLTDAIVAMTHTNGNNGAPTGTPINAPTFNTLKEEAEQLLSQVVKISK